MASTVKARDNIVTLPVAKVSEAKPRKKTLLKPGPVIIIMVISFVLYSFGMQILQMQENVHTMKQIQAQINELEKQNNKLKKEIKRLKTDAYIEKEAREKLGLVKPGEKMIIEVVPGKEVSP